MSTIKRTMCTLVVGLNGEIPTATKQELKPIGS